MSDSDSNPDILASICEISRQVASNLDAAVVDTLSTLTTTPPFTVTMERLLTFTTAITYNRRGLEFEVDDANPIINKPIKAKILYMKEHRLIVGSKDKADLIKAIISKQGDFCKEINTSYNDPESLKNNLALEQRLSHTESYWKNIDLLDPYYIMFPAGKGLGL